MAGSYTLSDTLPENALFQLLHAHGAYAHALAEDFTPALLELLESRFIEAALEFCEQINPVTEDEN